MAQEEQSQIQAAVAKVINGQADTNSLQELPEIRVEVAFRTIIKEHIQRSEHDQGLIVLERCLECVQQGSVPYGAIMSILEDAFEIVPMTAITGYFEFLDSKVETWTKEPFSARAATTRMLRLANSLKRRLSRSLDTTLCGRILMFLASVFDLADKSGVNLKSSVNTGNVTEFDETDEPVPNPVIEAAANATLDQAQQAVPIDKDFYRKFWQLQRCLHNPALCGNGTEWIRLTQSAMAVLEVFGAYKLADYSSSSKAHQLSAEELQSAGGMDTAEDGVSAEQVVAQATDFDYFAKYLTSPKLFHLQLSDINFRRQVLVQLLILMRYLQTESPLRKPAKVSPAQTTWIKETQPKVAAVLKAMGRQGKKFYHAVQFVIQREHFWVKWKDDGCVSFNKPSADKRVNKPIDITGQPHSKSAKLDLGHPELTRLWNVSKDNLEGCKVTTETAPDFNAFFEDAIDELDPEQQVEKTYWSINEPNFCWRSLRMLGKHRLDLCADFGVGSRDQDGKANPTQPPTTFEFLEHTIKKLGDDLKAGSGAAIATPGVE